MDLQVALDKWCQGNNEYSSLSSGWQLVHGNTQVPQLLALAISSVENLTVLSVLRYFDILLRYVRTGFPWRLDRLILL